MARIPQEKIDEIRSVADIYQYVSQYVSLKKRGQNFFGLCPFHEEKTGSFSVSPAKQIFHCFGCGKGGDVLTFLMEIEKISYFEALKKVASDNGITLPTQNKRSDDDQPSEYDLLYDANWKAKDFFVSSLINVMGKGPGRYLTGRQLRVETLKKFEVGYAPDSWDSFSTEKNLKKIPTDMLASLGLIQQRNNGKGYYDKFRNRIIFPFHNISGRIIGFGGRRLNEEDQPKYLNSPESKIYKKGELFYGLHQAIPAIRQHSLVIIVEGYFDLLRLVDNNIENVVASSGTALTDSQAKLLKRYTTSALISYDSDEAGIKAAIRNSDILERNGINVSIILLPKGHDPDTFILEQGRRDYLALFDRKLTSMELRVQRFLADNPDPGIELKNQFIDEVLSSFTEMPDAVRVGFLIHQLAEKFQIAESMLIGQYNKMRRARQRNIANKNAARQETEAAEKKPLQIKRGRWQAEEDVLSLLLSNDRPVVSQIFDHLSVSDFANTQFGDLYGKIMLQFEDLGEISLSELQREAAGSENESLLARLAMSEFENPGKYAVDCIYQIRKWHLDNQYNELKKRMQAEQNSPQSMQHYLTEMQDIRVKMNELEALRRSNLKINL
jgi:DNA primase